MSHALYHCRSSAARWGGQPEDYAKLHNWMDSSKRGFGDFRHRALLHHSEGCFLGEEVFGMTIINSNGRPVPTRLVLEQHVIEDLGRLPSFESWITNLRPQPWMGGVNRGKIHDHEDT